MMYERDEQHAPLVICAMCGEVFNEDAGHLCPHYIVEDTYMNTPHKARDVIGGVMVLLIIFSVMYCAGVAVGYAIKWGLKYVG